MRSRTRIAAVLCGALLLSGCVDPRPPQAQCVTAPRDVLDDIATGLAVDGTLRHGSLEIRNGLTFVSAELARSGDPEKLRGDLVTWVTGSLDVGEFFAVDVYARESSTWPPAPFDVREPGAIDSRACTAFRAGEPDPSATVDDEVPDDEGDGDDTPGSSIGF